MPSNGRVFFLAGLLTGCTMGRISLEDSSPAVTLVDCIKGGRLRCFQCLCAGI